MKEDKNCQTSDCWPHRHRVVGLILLILGSILTIITYNGLGIAAMVIVGGLLCCHKHHNKCKCGPNCACRCGTDSDLMCGSSDEKGVKKIRAKAKV